MVEEVAPVQSSCYCNLGKTVPEERPLKCNPIKYELLLFTVTLTSLTRSSDLSAHSLELETRQGAGRCMVNSVKIVPILEI